LGEITLDLRLDFKIPSSKLTINGLVLGLKEAAPQIMETILTTLLEAIEEKAVARQVEKDPQRYCKNGHQSKPRQFSCSLGDFSYRFAQLKDRKTGRSLMPLVEIAFDPGAGAVFGGSP